MSGKYQIRGKYFAKCSEIPCSTELPMKHAVNKVIMIFCVTETSSIITVYCIATRTNIFEPPWMLKFGMEALFNKT